LLDAESRTLYVEFFSFIKMCLTYKEIKVIKEDDNKGLQQKDEITFKTILFKSIKLLSMLCENCFQPFQVFF